MEGKGNGGCAVNFGNMTPGDSRTSHKISALEIPLFLNTATLDKPSGHLSWENKLANRSSVQSVDCQAPSSVLLTLNDQSASRPKKKMPRPNLLKLLFNLGHNIMFTLYIERIYLYV